MLLTMYRKILAAVNEHVNSEIAARYALHLAKQANARICFCSIDEKSITGKGFRTAEEAIKRLSARARELGVPSDCIFKTGDPFEQLAKVSVAEDIDLVFAATGHEDVEKSFYTRTTAKRLLLSLACSVALVRVVHMGRIHPSEILVPLKAHIDRIPDRAEFAATLAKAFGAKVHLFHVTEPMKKFFRGEIHLTPVEWEDKIPPDISRFIGYIDSHGVEHEKRLVAGRTGRTIAIEAAARHRDLIIMGASERGPLDFLRRGNPMEEVLRETPCNLIILKP
jgi:nucleotide-binding universal stress UspA family protein